MSKVIEDLTGMIFERLTVIGRGDDYISPKGIHIKQWFCKCNCGNEEPILVSTSNLKRGRVKSCGCYRHEKVSKREDLMGQKFGRLTVISRAEDHVSKGGYIFSQWYCKCDCGNKELIIVKSSSLKRNKGSTKSCGCLNIEHAIKLGKSKKRYNTYDITKEYGIGYTLEGEEFYFDLDDYDKIKDYCWHKNVSGYIVTTINNDICLYMHVYLMDKNKYKNKNSNKIKNKIIVDHIDRDKINNRKNNLRICRQYENSINRSIQSNNTSGIVGVNWDSRVKKWRAYIGYDKQSVELGHFNNIEDAIEARFKAEREHHKEYSPENLYSNNILNKIRNQ